MLNSDKTEERRDDGSLDQSSDDELDTTIGSCSLRDDLSSIGDMLSKLKSYSPDKKKKTRAAQGKLPQVDYMLKIIEYLEHIHQINSKLVSKVDSLYEDNVILKQQIELLKTPCSFAAAVSSKGLSDAVSADTAQMTVKPAPQELKIMTSKIDHLEQESLTNVIMLQGSAVETIVSAHSDHSATSVTTEGNQRNSKSAQLKAAVSEAFRTAAVPVQEDHIAAVWPQGRERKHLKVVCKSLESKILILSTIRNTRPDNLYANEYLTKHRSSLLYKLRCLRKQFPAITSAFSRNGVVCCKIRGNDRPIVVHEQSDVNKIEEKMLNARVHGER
jgi:hypothetical protein